MGIFDRLHAIFVSGGAARATASAATNRRSVRVTGRPTSSNGASSFHLFWELPRRPLTSVSVTIAVTDPPTGNDLFFWALQVGFVKDGRSVGAGHFGLQHHSGHPSSGAVNWGGYQSNGAELPGSASSLASAMRNSNTRDYQWFPGRSYRYHIGRSPERGWRGTITDLSTGEATVIRDLWADADYLDQPMMWSEVFAACDAPSVTVRWSDLAAVDLSGQPVDVHAVRTNYQTVVEGGCSNTNSSHIPAGLEQRTNAARTTPNGARVNLTSGKQ